MVGGAIISQLRKMRDIKTLNYKPNTKLATDLHGSHGSRIANIRGIRENPWLKILGAHPRPNLLPAHHAPDVAVLIQVEDDDGEVIVLAQADSGRIHHLQAQLQNIHVGNVLE